MSPRTGSGGGQLRSCSDFRSPMERRKARSRAYVGRVRLI
jgi:hypothetical protein